MEAKKNPLAPSPCATTIEVQNNYHQSAIEAKNPLAPLPCATTIRGTKLLPPFRQLGWLPGGIYAQILNFAFTNT